MKFKKMMAVLMAAAMVCTAGSTASVFAAESVVDIVESVAEETEVQEEAEGTFVVDAAEPVEVSGGLITGTTSEDGEVAIYKGIPYAAPPVGDLRWQSPVDVENWEGVKACDEFGPIAYQNWPNFDQPWMFVYSQEFLVDESKDTISEDCLYLNVWTKQGEVKEKRPVIVYIHGGGFSEGSGSIAAYDGTHIAEDDIVFVNINYRIGIFGFMTSEELDERSPYGTSGNYGIVDCIKALEWVRDNIEQFGGDPDNVTIAGQSAGGMAVEYLVSAPLAAGLFKNAVVFSGNYIRPGRSSKMTTKEEAQESFKEAYPDVTLDELLAMPADELYANYSLGFNAIVDGGVIREDVTDSLVNGTENEVNLLLNWVDGDVFSAFMPTIISTVEEYETWADETFGDLADDVMALYPAETDEEAAAAYEQCMIDRQIISAVSYIKLNNNDDKSAFIGYVKHEAPAADEVGMFHTGDIPYWLGGTLTTRAQYETDVDRAMYGTMKTYFENFIANADPNGEGLNEWAEYDGTYRYLFIGDDTYEMAEVPEEKGDFWLTYFDETSLDGALTEVANQ